MKNKFYWFLLFIGSLYLLWAMILPFDQAPDEYQRYDVANFIYTYKELPIAGDERLYYGEYGVTYAINLSFPYLLGSLLMIISDYIGSIGNLYLVHRLVSVISGIIAVFFVFKITCILQLSKEYKYLLIGFFALVPQFAFINSYVNLDSFTLAMITSIIYLLLAAEKNEWSRKYLFFLGLATGLILLSYLSGYVIIPAATVYMFLSIKNKIQFPKNILFIALIALVIAGPFFIRNVILYEDLLGLKTSIELSEQLAIEEKKPSNRPTPFAQGMPLTHMLFERGWLESTFNSFWATFGYMSIRLESKHYVVFMLLVFTSLIGIVTRGTLTIKNNYKGFKESLIKYRFSIMNFILIGLSLLLSIYYSYFSDYQPQGRYLYPAYFSIVFFITLGINYILNLKYKMIFFSIIIFYLLYLNIYSLYELIFIPFYS